MNNTDINIQSSNKSNDNNPLVSIIVITYNSSKYVLETLESVKAQTYQNIELIVSDDCSTDDTVGICRNWIAQNEGRFVQTKLIVAPENTGIPANCNRGVKAAKGEWVKLIAGDDILTSDSIQLFMNYICNHTDAKIIASVAQPFKDVFSENNFYKQVKGNPLFFHKNISAQQQYSILLFGCIVYASSILIILELIRNVGRFDEKYKYMEDYPYWLNLTQKGYKFFYLDKPTIYYRIHNESTYNKKIKNKIFNDFYKSKRAFEEEYIYPNINWFERFLYNIEYARKNFFNLLGLNRDNVIFKTFYYITIKLAPLRIYTNLKIRLIYRNITEYNG